MERYRFLSLNRQRQLRLIKLKGRILHRSLKQRYTVSLYQLENFYVETWENKMEGRIENLILYKDKTLLNYPFNMKRGREV